MYTGIVQALLPIETIERKPGLLSFTIQLPGDLSAGLETGASVATNGVCLTVTGINGDLVSFDVMQETLNITNIDQIEVGSLVNIERSARAGVEVGGHILSGHIIDTAKVFAIESTENNRRITFTGKPGWLKYVFNKGFLALNGASLTVAGIDRANSRFWINLIPETLKRTNFALLKEGDLVNVEVEHQTQVIVDTITRLMEEGMLEQINSSA